ncbi:hypothetical protein PWEIH_07751 [Listeria weihenstephanensis FSL R9-0317]|uniref:Uncharacterized protein n=1 Tax=Listeria weihenstephanensis TaxID=1006155 RepID=A0A1S7FW06_9LIST|nr:hypothetical protein [Listeria weihenstephanensis]AQY51515.1 hypothetical protein UE46_11040 [Listeria weihenstephanensis]EUJ39297.1 hypothetical protein PWEIH_07751 [Listeria weihenstephanensis FSL R9-0317]
MRELYFQEKMNGFQMRLTSENSKWYTYVTIIAENEAGERFEYTTKHVTFLFHPEIILHHATKKFNQKNPYGISFDWKKKADIILE